MDAGTIFAIASGVLGVIAGAFGGRLNALQSYAAINQILQSRIADLESRETEKDAALLRLAMKIESLEGLVTQKAEVAAVKAVVDRVALHLGV
jgi:hypothetical protein